MKGINFVTDDNNDKVAVLVDLNLYGNLWEYFYDKFLIEQRKNKDNTSKH